MPFIEVHPSSLQIVAEDLRQSVGIADEVARHRDRLTSYAADAGHSSVTTAVASFLDRWSYGCGCLVADTEHLAVAVRRASGGYVQVDGEVAKASVVER